MASTQVGKCTSVLGTAAHGPGPGWGRGTAQAKWWFGQGLEDYLLEKKAELKDSLEGIPTVWG